MYGHIKDLAEPQIGSPLRWAWPTVHLFQHLSWGCRPSHSSNPHDTSRGQASMNKAPWGSYSYQNRWIVFVFCEVGLIYLSSIENIRYMMGYIVDLTVILHWLFVSAHDVSASKVHEAMDYHVNSGRRDQREKHAHLFPCFDMYYHSNDILPLSYKCA